MIDGIVMLADQSSGAILALMDAKTVTAKRTGAVAGTSIRYLAKTDARSVGLVGCGTQRYYRATYACAARDVERVTVYDIVPAVIPAFVERLSQALSGREIVAAETAEALAKASDIVITATTARKPVFPDDPELFKGKHCVAIGSFQPDVREYPDAIFSILERVWVDIAFAREESGELLIPLDKGILHLSNWGPWVISSNREGKPSGVVTAPPFSRRSGWRSLTSPRPGSHTREPASSAWARHCRR